MSRARWVGEWRAVSERRNVWWEGKGAEAMGDWIVTNAMKRISGASVRATSRFSVKEMNSDKETVASNNRCADQ